MVKAKKNLFKKNIPFHLMMLPAIVWVIIFGYIPIAGAVIAFQDFKPAMGLFGAQEFVGLDNFKYILQIPGFWGVIRNTLVIAVSNLILNLAVPIGFALFLNEVRNSALKRSIQTISYLPHFLSWVILSGIFIDLLSPSNGLLTATLKSLNITAPDFLGDPEVFPFTIIVTNVWKNFGYGSIVYLASIGGIDTALYEAAEIDGAGRFKKMWHITLPGLRPCIVLLMVLSLGGILNAGFDQIFNMYSVQVYSTGDVLDTLIYRIGLQNGSYSLGTAVGLMKSLVSCTLISVSYYLAYKFTDYRVF